MKGDDEGDREHRVLFATEKADNLIKREKGVERVQTSRTRAGSAKREYV